MVTAKMIVVSYGMARFAYLAQSDQKYVRMYALVAADAD